MCASKRNDIYLLLPLIFSCSKCSSNFDFFNFFFAFLLCYQFISSSAIYISACSVSSDWGDSRIARGRGEPQWFRMCTHHPMAVMKEALKQAVDGDLKCRSKTVKGLKLMVRKRRPLWKRESWLFQEELLHRQSVSLDGDTFLERKWKHIYEDVERRKPRNEKGCLNEKVHGPRFNTLGPRWTFFASPKSLFCFSRVLLWCNFRHIWLLFEIGWIPWKYWIYRYLLMFQMRYAKPFLEIYESFCLLSSHLCLFWKSPFPCLPRRNRGRKRKVSWNPF